MLKNDGRIDPALAERIDALATANGLDAVLEVDGHFTTLVRFVDVEGRALTIHVVACKNPPPKPAIGLNVFEGREVDDWHFVNLVDIERVGPLAGYDSLDEFEKKFSLALASAAGSIDHTWGLTDESRVLTHPLALSVLDALDGDARLSLSPWRRGEDEGINVRSGSGREINVTFGYGNVEIVSPDFAQSISRRMLTSEQFESRIRASVEQALSVVPVAHLNHTRHM